MTDQPIAGVPPGGEAGPDADGRTSRIPETLPVLPLRGLVAYPGAVLPLTIGRERSLRMVDEAMRGDRLVALVAQRDPDLDEAGADDLFGVGTAARIVQLLRIPDDGVRIVIEGIERIRVEGMQATDPYLVARVAPLADHVVDEDAAAALRRAVLDLFRRLVPLLGLPGDLASAVEGLTEPRHVAYVVTASLPLELAVRQEVLETDPVETKLRRVVEFLQHELAVREVGASIAERTQERLTRAQRDAILREQLRSIQAELGEDGGGSEVADLRRRIDEAHLPDEARREAGRELDRLGTIPDASPEYGQIRTWLEWMASLPWSRLSGGEIDVAHAREVLDRDHYDLDEVKERILESLAVRKLRRQRGAGVGLGGEVDTGLPPEAGTGPVDSADATEPVATPGDDASRVPTTPADEAAREPILCFVGPPGVGKTSLGESIARALGRRFVRMSLGGIRDEAEIRGHRRTYVGAFPGRIVQGLRRAETRDPVFMLDEIDKVGADWRGDPTSALLEVLDPAQNNAFTDTYLGVAFDLSQVLFIATANTLDTIPGPLLDRMEILRIAGYTEDEKVRIAQRYLVDRERRAHGLTEEEVSFEEAALREIIRGYTREAGVRDLDRRIAQVSRKVARTIAEQVGRDGGGTAVGERLVIRSDDLPALLGRRRHFDEVAERTDRPGVATGLAWTPTGGEVLFVEAAMVPDGKDAPLLVTGMLGDVMRESAMAALTFVQSEDGRLGIDPSRFRDRRVHVHVPAGAMPKDGPSAGVAIATAIASIALGRPVRDDVAMTGEITLRGKVLPVGGIKEKVLAAHRAGIRTVILPARNEADLDDVPEELRRDLTIRLVDRVDEVLGAALGISVGQPAATRAS